VIDLWINAMVVSHTSATNCGCLYHCSFSRYTLPPPDWPVGFTLTTEHVWDAFIIACLLDDCSCNLITKIVLRYFAGRIKILVTSSIRQGYEN
jgi:hypothetical protein